MKLRLGYVCRRSNAHPQKHSAHSSRQEQAPLQQRPHVAPAVGDHHHIDVLVHHPVDNPVGLEENLAVFANSNIQQFLRRSPDLQTGTGACPYGAYSSFRRGASRLHPILRVLFIKLPPRRILPDVFPDAVQVFIVADNVIVKGTLPLEGGEAAFAYSFR